ncbi:hypothetical protein JCM10207_000131 [Rhodosporidiobolus poonsookiae]
MPKTRQSARISARASSASHDPSATNTGTTASGATSGPSAPASASRPAPTADSSASASFASVSAQGSKRRRTEGGAGPRGTSGQSARRAARVSAPSRVQGRDTDDEEAEQDDDDSNDDDDLEKDGLTACAPPEEGPPSLPSSAEKARSPTPSPPVDRLSPLSSELIALIFSFLAVPPVLAPAAGTAASPHAASPPSPAAQPDRSTLAALCLVSKGMLPHARAALYRDLKVETRVQAHAVHRTLHGSEVCGVVRHVEANVEMMAKTSSQWLGWFLFHSMHSLCGIIGSCRQLLTLTLYLPADSSAWTTSLCQAFVDLKNLHTLTKDLEPSLGTSYSPPIPYARPAPAASASASTSRRRRTNAANAAPYVLGPSARELNGSRGGGAGKAEGMDVGWRPRKSVSMWAVSQFIKPLSTLRSLTTLRLCGISSDSSTLPTPPSHSLKLVEVVLIEVNITNTDLLALLGDAKHLQRLTLWRSSLLSKRGLTHVLKRCPRLVEMRVGGSWFGAKEEDDRLFPLDDSLPHLPHLKVLFISGSLISPKALELPSLALSHLFVINSPSWTPTAVHQSLVKMNHDPPGVRRLTLPEMRDPGGSSSSRRRASAAQASGAGMPPQGAPAGSGEEWNETWRFTVRKTGEAKGVVVADKWRPGKEEEGLLGLVEPGRGAEGGRDEDDEEGGGQGDESE